MSFFAVDVIIEERLGLFGLLHWILSRNRKRQRFVSFS